MLLAVEGLAVKYGAIQALPDWTFGLCAVSYVIGRSWRFSLQQGFYRPSAFSLDGGFL